VLGAKAKRVSVAMGEVTVVVSSASTISRWPPRCAMQPRCRFEQLMDLCGIDYSDYKGGQYDGLRYAAVLHLLSVSLNQRVRLKVFCPDDDFPVLPRCEGLECRQLVRARGL
jgi:NADH-quinone oxidoreductase subunit C